MLNPFFHLRMDELFRHDKAQKSAGRLKANDRLENGISDRAVGEVMFLRPGFEWPLSLSQPEAIVEFDFLDGVHEMEMISH